MKKKERKMLVPPCPPWRLSDLGKGRCFLRMFMPYGRRMCTSSNPLRRRRVPRCFWNIYNTLADIRGPAADFEATGVLAQVMLRGGRDVLDVGSGLFPALIRDAWIPAVIFTVRSACALGRVHTDTAVATTMDTFFAAVLGVAVAIADALGPSSSRGLTRRVSDVREDDEEKEFHSSQRSSETLGSRQT